MAITVGSFLADLSVDDGAVEFADSLSAEIWVTLSAFANTDGGTLVLGASSSEGLVSTVGVQDPAAAARELEHTGQRLEPALEPAVRLVEREGTTVIVAQFAPTPAAARPCHLRERGPYASYCRVGSENVRFTQSEVDKMLAARAEAGDTGDALGAHADEILGTWVIDQDVRWGLDQLAPLVKSLGGRRVYVVRSPRWARLDLGFEPVGVWDELPSDRTMEAAAAVGDADVVVAIGGGHAIDLAKAASAERNLPVVTVPTTYSGAERTTLFGIRDKNGIYRGGGAHAQTRGIVYEPKLTLGLSIENTVGTAMNALDHCAEALYSRGRSDETDVLALRGAKLIAEWLPRVVERPDDLRARTHLLEGVADAAASLRAGMGLAHGMSQIIGGTYGLPHGTVNGICLPAGLRFNAEHVPDAVRRFAEAIGAEDPAARVQELAALGGPTRLRDLGVPHEDLPELAETIAVRPANHIQLVPATSEQILALLEEIW